ELHSPGFCDFVGKLNPLEVIRVAVNDAHERRKDREYKEPAEKRKLELENALLESQVLKQRVELAKSMGATDEQLRLLLESFVYRPLLKVSVKTEDALIEAADVRPFNE